MTAFAEVASSSFWTRAAVLGAAVAVAGALEVAVAIQFGGWASALFGAAAVVAVLLLRVPARWFPTLMLLSALAVPAGALPVPGFQGENGSVSPALLLVPLWLLRELSTRRLTSGWSAPRTIGAAVGVLVAGVLTASWVLGDHSVGSAAWFINFVLFALALALVLRADSGRLALRALIVAGAGLGLYAAAEAWVLHGNPVWGWASVSGGGRATASFGHPIYAGTVFAVAMVIAGREFIRRPSLLTFILTGGNALGLVAAGSRGALLAASTGLAVLAVAVILGRAGSRRQLIPLTGLTLVAAAVLLAGLAQREAAGEIQGSNVVRERSLETGLYLAERAGPLGFGPGRAYEVKTGTAGPGTDEARSIENAWIELYVAVGPIGTAAIGLFILICLVTGTRDRQWTGVAGTATLLVAYTFYNALEGAKPLTMILLGAALGSCLAASVAPSRSGSDPGASTREAA